MSRVELSGINLNLLVALDALLDERSVSRAARRVHVTPSAMSHSLAELRALLDDALLVRTGREMTPTPRAEVLRIPLRRVLLDAQRLVRGGDAFAPSTAERNFVIAAPDFLATLVAPCLLAAVALEAPRVTLEFVPSARRGNPWMLESGEVDVALGAVVDDATGIRRADLCTEGFACAVRADHPAIGEALDLETFARTPHLLITLGDDRRPTWIDQALALHGLERRVAMRVRSFLMAPLVLARSDLLTTGPSMLLQYFAELVPLRILEPPIALPTYPEEVYWHERFDEDAGHRWLRATIRTAFRGFGVPDRPSRRRWDG